MKRAWLPSLFIPLIAATMITGLLLLLPGKIMDGYDLARMHQCYKYDFRIALLGGEMPWWNPYTALGRPFLADIETATLYPLSWIVLPFGVTIGIILIIWAHLALAITGMRRLGTSLGLTSSFAIIAGIAFALSGALLGRIQSGQLQVFCVLCLWPWVWWAAIRLQDEAGPKALVCAAFWLALSFLAGSPQILWCGLVLLGALLAVRITSWRTLAVLCCRVTLAVLLAAGLAALQLLPFIELIHEGNRPIDNVAFAASYGEPGPGWLTLLLPPSGWAPSNGEYNLNIGAVFMVFACAALAAIFRERNVRALAAAGLLGVVLALGDRIFVLPGLAEWVPGFAGVRYPSRYALGTVVILSLLATWWLDQAFRKKQLKRPVLVLCLSLHGLTLLAGLFVQNAFYRVPAVPAHEARLMADLREEGLPRDGAPPRVALPASILRADAGAQCGVSTLTGFNNPALARTWTALYIVAGDPIPDFHRAEVRDETIIKLGQSKRYFGLSVVYAEQDHEIHFAPPPIPRAYLSFASSRVANWQEAVSKIGSGYDFVRQTLTEQDVSLPDINHPPDSQVDIVVFERNHLVIDYKTSAPGLLVLAEAWYPGWTARLNGTSELMVLPVNGWMRGIKVPAGNNRVVLSYRPTHWWIGLLITIGSLIMAFALYSGLGRRTHG